MAGDDPLLPAEASPGQAAARSAERSKVNIVEDKVISEQYYTEEFIYDIRLRN